VIETAAWDTHGRFIPQQRARPCSNLAEIWRRNHAGQSVARIVSNARLKTHKRSTWLWPQEGACMRMPEGRLLRRLIHAGARGPQDEFRSVAEEVIHEEREKRHLLLATELEWILCGDGIGRRDRARSRTAHDVPKECERGLPPLEVHQPVRDLEDVVLSDENRSIINEVLLEQGRSELLASYGIRPISRILLCGPPGCGKTTTAEVLATELDLELVLVRFDAVVSSFLGETAANLRKVSLCPCPVRRTQGRQNPSSLRRLPRQDRSEPRGRLNLRH